MKAKSLIILAAGGAAAVSAIVVGLLVAPEANYEGGTLTVIYTGDTYGELESCG